MRLAVRKDLIADAACTPWGPYCEALLAAIDALLAARQRIRGS